MNSYQGEIFSGEFDQSNESFYLTEVKSIGTGSEISLGQLEHLRNYVEKQEDSFMMTVNDQVPVLMKNDEVASLLRDISKIIGTLQS